VQLGFHETPILKCKSARMNRRRVALTVSQSNHHLPKDRATTSHPSDLSISGKPAARARKTSARVGWGGAGPNLAIGRGRVLLEAAAHIGAWLAEVLDGGRMKRRWREAMDRSEGRLVVARSLGRWWFDRETARATRRQEGAQVALEQR
jgi:hypothetical protein